MGLGDVQRVALSVISCWGHMPILLKRITVARRDSAWSSACLGLRSADRRVTLQGHLGLLSRERVEATVW